MAAGRAVPSAPLLGLYGRRHRLQHLHGVHRAHHGQEADAAEEGRRQGRGRHGAGVEPDGGQPDADGTRLVRPRDHPRDPGDCAQRLPGGRARSRHDCRLSCLQYAHHHRRLYRRHTVAAGASAPRGGCGPRAGRLGIPIPVLARPRSPRAVFLAPRPVRPPRRNRRRCATRVNPCRHG
eukprot:scaffold1320_cov113-Isochrysis_galbana.AAC.1